MPRLYADHQGYSVKVDFIIDSELLLEVNTSPPHWLRVRKKGFVLRALGSLGLLSGRKTGDVSFDDWYIVDNATQEQASRFLCPEVRLLLMKLEPFARFDLTNNEYRCLKSVSSLEAYTPRHVVGDIDTMIRIIELARSIDAESGAS